MQVQAQAHEAHETALSRYVTAYSVREAAERLGVSQRHVQRLIASGELPSVKLGKRRLIARFVLVDWLAGKPVR